MKKFKFNRKLAFVGGIALGATLTAAGLYFGGKFLNNPATTIFDVKPTGALKEGNENLVGILVSEKNRFGHEHYVTGGAFSPDDAIDLANRILDTARDVANSVTDTVAEA